jgi:hypothetical protein
MARVGEQTASAEPARRSRRLFVLVVVSAAITSAVGWSIASIDRRDSAARLVRGNAVQAVRSATPLRGWIVSASRLPPCSPRFAVPVGINGFDASALEAVNACLAPY